MDRRTIALVAGIGALSGFCGGAAVVGLFSLRAAPAIPFTASTQTITARAFVVGDKQGKHRTVLDSSGLVLLDAKGKKLASLGLAEGSEYPSLFVGESEGRVWLRGSALVMVDTTGKSTLSLGRPPGDQSPSLTLEGQAPSLRLFAKDGRASVLDLATLTLADKGGKVTALLGTAESGEPSLILFDKRGKRVARLDPTALGLSDKNGHERATLATSEDGNAALLLSDERGHRRAILGTSEDGKPSLFLLDKDGKQGQWLNATAVSLFDRAGHDRAVLGSTELETVSTGSTEETAPSSLTLFDKKGKVIWQAP